MASVSSLNDVLDEEEWNLEKIKNFLEHDSSSVNEEYRNGNFNIISPLIRVLKDNKCTEDIVKLLLSYDADVNFLDPLKYFKPLYVAIRYSRSAAVTRLLLEAGANVNGICLCFSFGPLTSKDTVQLLADAGCSFTCGYHDGSGLLHRASRYIKSEQKEEVLQFLIKKMVISNVLNTKMCSPLFHELGKGNKLLVLELLLAVSGSLNACHEHHSPLLCVTQVNVCGTLLRANLVEMLLKFVEDASGRLSDTKPLQCALKYTNCETKAISLLFNRLQDVNTLEEESNNSLLHIAVSNPYTKPSIVKLLIKGGVKVDLVNKNGDTALHEALRLSHTRISTVETLIESGSPVNLFNASGKNSMDIAVECLEVVEIIKMLFIAGARIGVYGYYLINKVIKKCDTSLEINLLFGANNRFNCCKMLTKCYFLENPDCNFEHLIQGHNDYEALSRFGADCLREVRKLNSKDGRALREFLCGYSSYQEKKSYNFNELLRIIAQNESSLFFDIIASKVGRSSMIMKLQEVDVYTIKCVNDQKERVTLNYDGVCEVAKRLLDEDLLRFLLAFHRMDRSIHTTQTIKEESVEGKRKYEHPEQFHKHPRLQ